MGRSQPLKQVPDGSGSETSSGIFRTYSGHIRAYPGIFRAYSGHFRTREARRVPYRLSPVTPSRNARRGGNGRRRIACRRARRVPYRPSPGTASRMVVALPYRPVPDRVRYRLSLTPVSSHPGPPWRPHVSAMFRSGTPHARRLPIPGPTAPVADAATDGLRTYFLLHGRGDS